MAIAGSIQPVSISASPPVAGPAIPIVAYASNALPADRALSAGPAQAVYVVSAAELASGAFHLAGNTQPLVMTVTTGRTQTAGRPIPIYVVSGTLS